MNKKLISALFVGALLLGSTSALTSCKDYDDDINSLQSQIDKAALASDVAALKTSLDAATATATAAKTTAESALAKAQAANDALAAKAAQADLTAAVARITALEAQMTKLTNFETELKAAVDSKLADLQKQFDALKTEIMQTIGSMVTHVSLIGSYFSDFFVQEFKLYPVTGKQIKNTFGKTPAADKIITYNAGDPINFPVGLLIRVNPTNYTPAKDDIKLVNSLGKDLSSVLDIVSVEPYDELIVRETRAVGNSTGLWKVGVQLKDGKTSKDLEALTLTKDAGETLQVLYAVAINNTTDSTRSVVSTYDVAFPAAKAFAGAKDLDNILVNNKEITNWHNRYNSTEASAAALTGGKAITPWEKIWNVAPTSNPATAGTTKDGDNRQTKPLIMATLGQEIPISFENYPAVQYYYVTLDTKNSVDSDNSEINAWNSYSYTGLNTIYATTDGKSSVSVTAMGKTEDIIGFRIYAVNYDGTLADPDGIAFYIYVGDKSNVGSATGDFVPTQNTPNTTAAIPVSGSFVKGGDFSQAGNITFKNGATGTYALYKADGKSTPADWSEVGSVKFTITSSATAWDDGATSTAQIIGTKNGTPLNIINVSLTKKLPTAFPTEFGWKASQLVDGVYTCYVDPVTGWTTLGTKPNGQKDMTNVCNGLTDPSYVFTIENVAKDNDGKYTKSANFKVPYMVTVDNALIDNSTAHSMTISYTYFDVSSVNDPNNGYNVIVPGKNVSVKFACILNTTLQTYAWQPIPAIAATSTTPAYPAINVNQLKYSTDITAKQYIPATFLMGANAYDATTWSKSLGALKANYSIKEAKLISKETGTVDYFTATANLVDQSVVTKADGTKETVACFEFTPLSSTSVPTVNVPSTLKVTLVDAFGHENVYSLDVVVNK